MAVFYPAGECLYLWEQRALVRGHFGASLAGASSAHVDSYVLFSTAAAAGCCGRRFNAIELRWMKVHVRRGSEQVWCVSVDTEKCPRRTAEAWTDGICTSQLYLIHCVVMVMVVKLLTMYIVLVLCF